MRKFLVSLALVSTAIAAAPAMAQGYGQRSAERPYDRDGGPRADGRHDDDRGGYDRRGDYDGGFRGGGGRQALFELSRDLDRIDARIERSVQRGNLSRRAAFGLRREVQQVRFELRRAHHDGIRGRELGQLRFQVARLEQRLRYERNDRYGRRF